MTQPKKSKRAMPRPRREVTARPLPTDPEAAIDVPQLGVLLGQAPITIYQAFARGEGPRFFRVGRSIRIRLGDALAYRDARTVGRRGAP